MNITKGTEVPNFKAKSFWQSHEPQEFDFELDNFTSSKLVLVFYPGDFTPVCTKEMCDFSDNLSALKDLNAQVVGISTDNLESHKKFAARYQLDFPLIADIDKNIGELFNVKGRLLANNHRRAIFILDENKKVIFDRVELSAIFRTEAKEIQKFLNFL